MLSNFITPTTKGIIRREGISNIRGVFYELYKKEELGGIYDRYI